MQQVGLDCANWEPAVYHDLLRYGDGSPEALLSNYFNTVGYISTGDVASMFMPVNRTYEQGTTDVDGQDVLVRRQTTD